jgi:hypothetical protein
MARILMIGPFAEIEFEQATEDGQVIATCVKHSTSDGRLAPAGDCSWTAQYEDWIAATERATDHADRGDQ